MVSELKPCPFCGSDARMWPSHTKADKNGSYEIVGCSNVDCFIEPTTDEYLPYEEAVQRWNTRPAPAATDTGLVTVAKQWKVTAKNWSGLKPEISEPFDERELVTRSQAEAIITQERKQKDHFADLAEQRFEELRELKDDNAALTALVKELEDALIEKRRDRIGDAEKGGSYLCRAEKAEAKAEALEAKLAAAEKALERADDALQLEATASGHTYVKIALGEVRS